MRGSDGMQEALFTVAKLEDFVPADHPLRAIRGLVNEALGRLNGLFNLIYADTGRASIAPEKLLRAMLIQVFFSVRSERQLMEQVRYNLVRSSLTLTAWASERQRWRCSTPCPAATPRRSRQTRPMTRVTSSMPADAGA